MRNEEMIIDVADPMFTKTIRSRQNDKNGLKITVYVREKGQPIDLTGYAVKYEATNHTGGFIRDEAQIVDAKNGVFAYTLSAQAVSTSDDWTAYFVIEKGTERMSTPDIRITLRRDVKEGNMKIENYISEFDGAIERVKGYRKEIDEANQKIKEIAPYIDEQYLKTNKKIEELGVSIAANGVVKKVGDTMTGPLVIDHKGVESPLQVSNPSGRFRFLPQKDWNTVESGTVDGKAKNLNVTGTNNTMLDKVQVKTKEWMIEGTAKQAIVGIGTNEVYMGNAVTKKYLQFKDDGTLSYSGKKVGFVEDMAEETKKFMQGFTNFKNGFHSNGSGNSFFYGIDQFGWKHIQGLVEGGSTEAGAVIGSLPECMKPAYWATVTAVYDTTGGATYSPCAVNIAWNGDIICQTKRSASSFIIINGMYL
ncbi:BppU family phage baseplate upper protein [Bacillus cereus]|uniref:BppU family phage baseplate upper protein n=1 Tax=Bacillus cereus TaxID=1396 RepID=UPI00240708F2|nr:BppU family phage baseplate upper protein [Bacillus cereus]MDF9622599.1 BppU family phage baseplate upper protein [Bacillus cereus]